MKLENKKAMLDGLKAGIPIGLGYFAVSFSLGITARSAGLNALEAFFASFLCNASAGEYGAFTVIASNGAYIEMALITFIANCRYLLMSCAMGQRLSPDMKLGHRLLIGFDLNDELFGCAISREGFVNPFFYYGMMMVSCPMWWAGTTIGNLAGNILPSIVVFALCFSLYGMFLAVIIPPTRKSKIITGLIAVCFVLSYIANYVVKKLELNISNGIIIIILTVIISSAVALIFPHNDEEKEAK